eukprot:TRINITY_DN3953_c0_g1_i1.p1 TRINITY_DN3953_c0_g1~~TRINITY_DN3953_c0_g1_i1.p1  ORF type:complete len:216 (-),score=50.84 TRINITY_DN3953_c0_g1_i1:24-671(-)
MDLRGVLKGQTPSVPTPLEEWEKYVFTSSLLGVFYGSYLVTRNKETASYNALRKIQFSARTITTNVVGFGSLAFGYVATTTILEKLRGKDDWVNNALSAALAGMGLGLWQTRSLLFSVPLAIIFGSSAGFSKWYNGFGYLGREYANQTRHLSKTVQNYRDYFKNELQKNPDKYRNDRIRRRREKMEEIINDVEKHYETQIRSDPDTFIGVPTSNS